MSFLSNLFGGNNQNEELLSIIQEGAFLVDVREPSEVATGGVVGAVNIPMGSVASNLKEFEGKSHIVVFCRSGNRSGQVKTFLNQNGFTNVTNGGTWEDINSILNKI